MSLHVAMIGGNKPLLKSVLDEFNISDIKQFSKLINRKEHIKLQELNISALVINNSLRIFPKSNYDLFDKILLRTFRLEAKANKYNGKNISRMNTRK